MKPSKYVHVIGVLGLAALFLPSPAMSLDFQSIINEKVGAFKRSSGGHNKDFGKSVESHLRQNSKKLFGVKGPIVDSAEPTEAGFRKPGQPAKDQVKLAKSLKVEYVTRDAARHADQFAFWPNDYNPEWLIFCIEIFPSNSLNTGNHPAVQRIRIRDGKVETIVRGLLGCDGIRRTPWNTILATEEVSDGYGWEIIDPLNVTNHQVTDRASGAVQNETGGQSTKVVRRTALPKMAWEGIHITKEGVLYAGDELRPGTGTADSDGGALYKFIPNNLWNGGSLQALNQSPFTAGSVYAAQMSCRDDRQQYGQGCEIGNGSWVAVNASDARFEANANGATGYYRPEDLGPDPLYHGEGVKVCWANTQNQSAALYAEIQCAVDLKPTETPDQRSIIINRFVEGDQDFNAFDNVAFQPYTGNLYVIEDRPNGDIFACLRDGEDRNIKSDGCVKILSVRDSAAEPTGFKFDATGKTAYFSIQHSNDDNMPLVDSGLGIMFPTDDVLKVTGFSVPKKHHRY